MGINPVFKHLDVSQQLAVYLSKICPFQYKSVKVTWHVATNVIFIAKEGKKKKKKIKKERKKEQVKKIQKKKGRECGKEYFNKYCQHSCAGNTE